MLFLKYLELFYQWLEFGRWVVKTHLICTDIKTISEINVQFKKTWNSEI